MLEEFNEAQPYFVKEIMKLVKKNRISHAYLIETRNYDDANSVVLAFAKYLYCSNHHSNDNLCYSCSLCNLIDSGSNGDFLQIFPDGSWIKKEQIINIKEKFMTKPLSENSPRIYVIYEAEKLNKQAANSLLKFLEEPDDNIIAILVTENRYKILDTIRSRCQIFSFINTKNEIHFEDYEFLESIIDCIESKKVQAIAYLPTILENQYYGKDFWEKIFVEMQYVYEQALKKKEDIEYSDFSINLLDFILKNNTEASLLHKLDVIDEQIRNLSYNLNINLMLDSFIIKFCKTG